MPALTFSPPTENVDLKFVIKTTLEWWEKEHVRWGGGRSVLVGESGSVGGRLGVGQLEKNWCGWVWVGREG